MEQSYAVLEINILYAKLKRSTNSWYKMDPYCKVSHHKGKDFVQTKPAAKGDKQPIWNFSSGVLIDDMMAADMIFDVCVYNKNAFGKDSMIGENKINLDYIINVQKLENADFKIYFKNKEVGVVYMNLAYKDGTDADYNTRFEQIQMEADDDKQDYSHGVDQNDLEYEYSPNDQPKPGKAQHEAPVIAIDASLSPLDANLALNNSMVFFKFDSPEVYQFDFNSM